MNALLITLTIISVIAAVACAWFAWRLREAERRRSDARVAALSGAIDALESASAHWPQETVEVISLFQSDDSPAVAGAPMVKVAVGVAMGIILLIALAMSNRGVAGDTAVGADEPRAVVSRATAPLELVSMRYERAGDTLRVSGLVRNPRTGGTMTGVTAVVFAFSRAGAFVASGRAGLDFVTLEPGDESPFLVTLPGVTDVGRYRVSFRTDDGLLQHLDRRADHMRLAALEQD